MPFRFPLSPVLRLRESLERREYLALQALYSQAAEVRSDIKAVEQVLAQARSQRSTQLLEGIPAAHLQLELEGEARVAHRREALTAQLIELQGQVRSRSASISRHARSGRLLRNCAGSSSRNMSAKRRPASSKPATNSFSSAVYIGSRQVLPTPAGQELPGSTLPRRFFSHPLHHGPKK